MNLDELRKLEDFADDRRFRKEWRRIKRENKNDLATLIGNRTGVTVNPDSLFDIQVKRLHEYKRQHLNVLHIITLYARLKRDPGFRLRPPDIHLRRKGRTRIHDGQADHQTHHFGGRRGE